ncbi:LysR family transcriptional regulator [Pseudomonas fluorescens]|uniref:LysR family transcriptional regulator n=1 Tax=Pseudomonas fluorescens TaxID=294 RepID=A0A379IG01_PSEFL|nr:LysR family transcriptional regulator [Pseudomonas fluorescens]AIG01896.1 LysR family transcriptional regulator [Pseudomonas fluorescens]SUD31694.1 LysR family transcriptional regulator [Pseudomonas fluorescens]
MQLRALRYFHEVARCASLRKAAERLYVTPTAVSRQIEHLEHFFGAALIERGPRGIRLTVEGECLAEQVTSTLRGLDQVRDVIASRQSQVAGNISIHVSESIVSTVLAPVLAAFYRAHPKVTFNIVIASASATLDALCSGEADLGLAFYLQERADVEVFAQCELWHRVLVSAEHPFAQRDSIELHELEGQPLAIPDSAYGVRQALEAAAKKRGVTIQPVFTTSSLEVQKSLARQRAAVLILPQVDADARDLGDGLVAVPIADEHLGRIRIDLCGYRNRPRSVAVLKCQEMLASAMQRCALVD